MSTINLISLALTSDLLISLNLSNQTLIKQRFVALETGHNDTRTLSGRLIIETSDIKKGELIEVYGNESVALITRSEADNLKAFILQANIEPITLTTTINGEITARQVVLDYSSGDAITITRSNKNQHETDNNRYYFNIKLITI